MSDTTRGGTGDGDRRYDGFISYSHAVDGELAPALQRGLQRFAKPWWKRRALRVFRDEASLSASPHLWSSIEQALAASEWFVLLASPTAARSDWVTKELRWWLDHRDPRRILPVVTDGAIVWDHALDQLDLAASTAVSGVLAEALTEEPRWVDLRWAEDRTDVDLRNPRFRDVLADIAAPLHGVAKDDLESEEVRQQRRARRTAITGVIALAALTVLALVAGSIAISQRDQADAQRALAEEALRRERTERLVAEAPRVASSQLDLGLLLAIEVSRREPGPRTDAVLLEVLTRAGPVTRVASLPGSGDGQYFFPPNDPDQIWLFDEVNPGVARPLDHATGKIGEPVEVREGAAGLVDLSRQGLVAVVYQDGAIELVDHDENTVVADARLADGLPRVVAVADDRQLAVLAPDGNEISFLSVPDLVEVNRIALPGARFIGWAFGDSIFAWTDPDLQVVSAEGIQATVSIGAEVRTVAADESSGIAAAWTVSGELMAWRLDNPESVDVIFSSGDGRIGTAMAFGADAETLYSGLQDGTLLRHDMASNGETTRLASLDAAVLAISPDESGAALAASTSTSWLLLDPTQISPTATVLRSSADGEYADALALSHDQIAIGMQPGTVELVERTDGSQEGSAAVGESGTTPAIARVSDGWIASVVEFPATDIAPLRSQQAAVGITTQHALAAGFELIENIQRSHLVKLDDSGRERWRAPMANPVVGLASLADGSVVALDVDSTIWIIDPTTGDLIDRINDPRGFGWWIESNGTDVIVGGFDFTHFRSSGGSLATRGEHLGAVASLAGDELAFADGSGRLRLADIDDIQAAARISAVDLVTSRHGPTLLPGSRFVLADLRGGDLVIHDLHSGITTSLGSVTASDGWFQTAPINDHEFLVLTSSGDLSRWDIGRDNLRRRACDIAGRDLTDDEWATYLIGEDQRRTCTELVQSD